MDCREQAAPVKGGGGGAKKAVRPSSVTRTQDLSTAEVLERFSDGPTDGIFTDGSSRPNPGPGGWGAVFVRGNTVVEERHGADAQTTNNRMELTALIAGLEMAPPAERVTIYTDSLLLVNTLTKWAKGWEARGWKRKEGEIANLGICAAGMGAGGDSGRSRGWSGSAHTMVRAGTNMPMPYRPRTCALKPDLIVATMS